MKKNILLAFLFLSPALSYANTLDIEFRCTDGSAQSCEQRVTAELDRQGCGTVQNSIRCEAGTTDKDAFYCSARTENCYDASSDGFTGVTCRVGEKVKIKDRKLSATWARSIFWIWVRDLCKTGA